MVANTISRLVGVYNGDGGIRGEVAFVFGKLRGAAECALCDITHRGFRTNGDWSDFACELDVPFDLVHLNERDAEVAVAGGDDAPYVLAETDGGWIKLLGPAELKTAGGAVAPFRDALLRAVDAANLVWPGATASVEA